MLTSFLSRIFWVAFVMTLIGSISAIISQMTLRPLNFKIGRSGTWTVGQPGLVFKGRIVSQDEKLAPDTIINYAYITKTGSSGNGGYSIKKNNYHDYKKDLDSLIKIRKQLGEDIKLDTLITLVLNQNWDSYTSPNSFSTVDSINDNAFIYRVTYQDEKQNKIKETRDTFRSKRDAETQMYLGPYKTSPKISEEVDGERHLRILPANLKQQVIFISYFIITIGCLALLFLTLSSLFNSFHKQNYFTLKNVLLLKRCGWLLLIPQLSCVIFYWTILVHIHPAKVVLSYPPNNFKILEQYDLQTDLSWTVFFIGLGMLVAAYIFKNGLKLKEEQALTV